MPNIYTDFNTGTPIGFLEARGSHNIITEIDITLENGDKVMIVEVKSKPSTEDITEHLERMEKVKTHANLHAKRVVRACANNRQTLSGLHPAGTGPGRRNSGF